MTLQGLAHGKEQGNYSILRHGHLLHGHQGNDVVQFTADHNRCRAGIPELAFLNPHLRAEHPERCLMFQGHADGRGAHLVNAHIRPFDFARGHLIKGQGIALEYRAICVNEQQTQVVFLEKFLDAIGKVA